MFEARGTVQSKWKCLGRLRVFQWLKRKVSEGERKSVYFSAECVKVESWLIRDQPAPGGANPLTFKKEIRSW